VGRKNIIAAITISFYVSHAILVIVRNVLYQIPAIVLTVLALMALVPLFRSVKATSRFFSAVVLVVPSLVWTAFLAVADQAQISVKPRLPIHPQ